jgi:hypothetical protein
MILDSTDDITRSKPLRVESERKYITMTDKQRRITGENGYP